MSAGLMTEPVHPAVARELWSSFISLVRGYTAAHGLNGTRQAVLEVSDTLLLVRAGERLLTIRYDGDGGSFVREGGAPSQFAFDDHGRVLLTDAPEGLGSKEEMDMVAERLAREIMR